MILPIYFDDINHEAGWKVVAYTIVNGDWLYALGKDDKEAKERLMDYLFPKAPEDISELLGEEND